MEMGILAYGHELLWPSVTPKRLADGFCVRQSKRHHWSHSGLASDGAVSCISFLASWARMTGPREWHKSAPRRPIVQHVNDGRHMGAILSGSLNILCWGGNSPRDLTSVRAVMRASTISSLLINVPSTCLLFSMIPSPAGDHSSSFPVAGMMAFWVRCGKCFLRQGEHQSWVLFSGVQEWFQILTPLMCTWAIE